MGFEFEGLGLGPVADFGKLKDEVAATFGDVVRRWLKHQRVVDVVFACGGASLPTLLVEVVDEDGGDSLETEGKEPFVDGVPFLFGVFIETGREGSDVVEDKEFDAFVKEGGFAFFSPEGIKEVGP